MKAKPNEKQLAIAFENVAVGMALFGLDRRYVVCNRALAEMLGFTKSELTEKNLDALVHPSDREEALAAFERLACGESERAQLELRLLRKNGETLWTRVTGSTVLDERGKPVFVVVSAEDIGEYKRAGETAIAARESIERLIETTDAIVVQLNAAGEIQFVNPAFSEITGYSRADLEGKSWFETLVPKDRYPQVREEFLRLTSGGMTDRFENTIVTKDGEERYIVWRNSSLESGNDSAGTVSIGIDITERRRAEEALADSEEKMLAVFTSAPAGMVVSSVDDGRILDVNQEFERLFECQVDEIVGKTEIELGFWADPADRTRLIDLIEKDGKVEEFELQVRAATGKEMVALVTASLLTVRDSRYLIYSLQDITERKQAEKQLALLKHAVDSHYDSVYWTDTDNRLVYTNFSACVSLGYECDYLIGKPISLVDPGATEESREKIWEWLRRDGVFTAEATHRRADGREFPVEIVSTYVQFGGREYNCAFARDISERKEQERERAQLSAQLVQAQRMEAVGRLAGGVAHNFNNILTALIGYCELLLTKLPEGADGHQEAEQIKLAADHAALITRELLLFSQREAGRHVKLDLNAIVVQTRLLLRELIRRDVHIVAALAPIVAPIKADRGQIEQVLINLVINANDAMPDGGEIAIETADVEINEQLVEGSVVLEPGRYVTLTVTDGGIGMDEETQARIFEPFFSTKGHEQGSGLGLATVYGIVEESGGRIFVDSKPNAGTKITIYLPSLPGRDS